MPDGEHEQDVIALVAQEIEKAFRCTFPDLVRAHATGRAAPGADATLYWSARLAAAQLRLGRLEDELVVALGADPGEVNATQQNLAHRVNRAVEDRDLPAVILQSVLHMATRERDKRSAGQQQRLTVAVSTSPPRQVLPTQGVRR